jgi:two-component system, response regulator RegA
MKKPVHLLIVEDHAGLSRSLSEALSPRVESVRIASSVRQATSALAAKRPDWILLDLILPDGSGFDVLDAASVLSPVPHCVVLSASQSREEAFRLAKLGVAVYLEKPATLAEVERAFFDPPTIDLSAQIRPLVGRRSLESVEDEVRSTLVDEALATASGSKSQAARLLSISRQLLQHIVRRKHGDRTDRDS